MFTLFFYILMLILIFNFYLYLFILCPLISRGFSSKLGGLIKFLSTYLSTPHYFVSGFRYDGLLPIARYLQCVWHLLCY